MKFSNNETLPTSFIEPEDEGASEQKREEAETAEVFRSEFNCHCLDQVMISDQNARLEFLNPNRKEDIMSGKNSDDLSASGRKLEDETPAVASSKEEDEILNEIQPIPSRNHNYNNMADSQPGAYATQQSTAPLPSLTSLVPSAQDPHPIHDNNNSNNNYNQGWQEHLVEASLVEEEIPMAEIVSSPEDPPSLSVEEGFAQVEPDNPTKMIPRSRGAKYLLFGVCTVLTLAVVALGVAGLVCGTGHCSSKESSLSNITAEEDPTTTTAGSSSIPSWIVYNASETSESDLDGMVLVPLGDTSIELPIYTVKSLEDPSTAQSRALEWLATTYQRKELMAMEEWHKRQLFALATICFSLIKSSSSQSHQQQLFQHPLLNTTTHECNWTPITIGTSRLHFRCTNSGEIRSLRLYDFPDTPVLPAELELLPRLIVLAIENSGSIGGTLEEIFPKSLASSLEGRLRKLKLTNNGLTGSIPSYLFELTKLTSLELRNNVLYSSVPTELGLMLDLTSLGLFGNELTGSVPSEMGLLTNLARFDAHSNQLDGEIPSQLGQLTALEIIDVSYNDLEGSIPPELGMLTQLEHLWIQENNLSGTVPETVCLLTEDLDSRLYDFSLDCLEEVVCPINCSCTSCS